MREIKSESPVQVMGIINVTPDSFSDGGQFDTIDKAFEHARELIETGVNILDIGGESTRPGSKNVTLEEELNRTIPLINSIREISDIPISIDTNKSAVMQQAVAAGATIINSVWALQLGDSLKVAAELDVPVCFMHMLGTPETMQNNPVYEDVVVEVMSFLQARIEAAMQAGIREEHIIIDPGFGFGKTIEHNLQLLSALSQFKALNKPILVGLSRKRMIGAITGKEASERVHGSVACAVMAARNGADIIRVHDVAETMDAIAMVNALNQFEATHHLR